MKRIIEVTTDGLESLLGEKLTFFSLNYIYHGKLTGVNEKEIILEDAYIVYETGAFSDKGFKDAQFISKEWRLMIGTIESYGKLEK